MTSSGQRPAPLLRSNYGITTTSEKEWGFVIRPETEAAWPSEDVSKLGGFPGRSPKSLVDMQSAMEEKNTRLICLKEAPLKEEELVGGVQREEQLARVVRVDAGQRELEQCAHAEGA